MISGASVLPFRNVVLCIAIGTVVIFLVLQAGFALSGRYPPMSWPLFSEVPYISQNRNETLGVASRLYVLSLPDRTDRRKEMEQLRKTLGLRWTYIEALEARNVLVGRIMNSVRSVREAYALGVPFIWPDVLLPSNHYIDPWSFEFPSYSTNTIDDQPLVCATHNNTIEPYSPNLSEFRILTPARIACWYSHITVIGMIANDRTLKDDDAAIILEDDVNMELDIRQRLEHVWTFLPRDWHIVYLGHCWSNETFYPALNAHENTTDGQVEPVSYIHPSKKPSCTHAYALSRSGARRILLHLRYPLFAYSRAIDRAVSWLIECGRLNSYSIVPSIVVQRKVGHSDIMPGKGSQWKDDLVNGVFDGRKNMKG